MAKKKRYKKNNKEYENNTFVCVEDYEPELLDRYDRLEKLERAGNDAYTGEF